MSQAECRTIHGHRSCFGVMRICALDINTLRVHLTSPCKDLIMFSTTLFEELLYRGVVRTSVGRGRLLATAFIKATIAGSPSLCKITAT